MTHYVRLLILTILTLFLITVLTAIVSAQDEACCYPDGSCDTIDRQVCIDQGGTPLGPGTVCSGIVGACCIAEGDCWEMDSICCVENGYTFYGEYECGELTCDTACELVRFEMNRLADYNQDGAINIGDATLLTQLYSTQSGPPKDNIFDSNGDCYVGPEDVERLYLWYSAGWLYLKPADCLCIDFVWYGDSCEQQFPGDVDNDGNIDISDATYLTAWLYQGGGAPPVLANADPDGNCCADSSDIVYITDYLFHGGPAPVECTCVDIEFCNDTCYASGDVNGDGVSLTVADLVNLKMYLLGDTTMNGSYFEGDLNGDCRLDYLDYFVYEEFFDIGIPAFAPYGGYPVPTCCSPDTLRGSVCRSDSCLILHPMNVTDGIYNGDYTSCTPVNPCTDTCEGQYPGDVNNNGQIAVDDLNYLINWLYDDGPAPPITANADVNGNCCVDTLDVIYLTDYIFNTGPAPVDCTCWDVDFCPDTCVGQFPGDVNNDGRIAVDDISYLTNWLYTGGPPPPVMPNADPNGTCCVDTFDIVYLTDYVFNFGAAPVPCTCWETDLCDSCETQYPGDVNKDGVINISDMSQLIDFLVNGGPYPGANADVNGDCWIEFCDVSYMEAFIFLNGPAPVDCTCEEPEVCDCNIGDFNFDGDINVGDAVAAINHVFKGGPGPTPYDYCSGDANFDCGINVGDAVAIVNLVFNGGPPPPCCHEWIDETDGCGLPLR